MAICLVDEYAISQKQVLRVFDSLSVFYKKKFCHPMKKSDSAAMLSTCI